MVTVGAVFALAAALAGRAHKPLLALAGARAIDAIQAHAVPEAGAPGFSWAGLALLAEEPRAALPGLETQKCCAESQGGKQGERESWIFTRACSDRMRGNGFKLKGGRFS